jgi:SAM-dependent methyltransferase
MTRVPGGVRGRKGHITTNDLFFDMVSLTFFGGVGKIGGNKIMLRDKDSKILLDFVLANGLLCSMAPQHHEAAVNEIRRVLKPTGLAYLGVAKGSGSFVRRAEWEKILEGFRVERRGSGLPGIGHRWAVVRPLVR